MAGLLLASACGRIGFERLSLGTDSGVDDAGIIDAENIDAEKVDAGAPVPKIVDTGAFPFRIVAGTTHVYWSDFSDGSIHSIPIAGGTSTLLVGARTAPAPYGLTFADGNLFYCDSDTGTIWRVSALGGGVPITIQSSPCFDVAVSSTHLYWTSKAADEPTIRRRTLPDGIVEDLGAIGDSGNLELFNDIPYWSSYGDGLVSTYDTEAVQNVLLTEVLAGGPWGLVVTSDFVYFAEHHSATGTISRVHRAGGATVTLAEDQDGPHQIVEENGVLFWTNEFAGTIMRLAPGGVPTVLASGQDRPLGIAITESAIFWTTRGGKVVRLAR